MKKGLDKIVEGLLWIWSHLDDWSKFMPSTDPISAVIKWVLYFLGKIGDSVRVSYYKSKYATKEAVELIPRKSKNAHDRDHTKDRRKKTASNWLRRTRITVAKAKRKSGTKLTESERKLLEEIE